MEMKFFQVILLTGIGHVLAFIFFPLISTHVSDQELIKIAKIDSAIIMLLSVIGFGINATSTRDVALSSQINKVVADVQSARSALAWLVSFIAVIYMWLFGFSTFLLVLLAAPLFALNYDQILYGLGKPLSAAWISFVRQTLPLLFLLIVILLTDINSYIYFGCILIFYLIACYFVAKACGAALFYRPSAGFLRVYASGFWVGCAGIAIAMLRLGYLEFLPAATENITLVQLVFMSKFCIFILAARRILIQFFYKEICAQLHSYKIDYWVIFGGLALLVLSTFIIDLATYTDIQLPYGRQFYISCGVAAFAVLLAGSSDAKLLFHRQDKVFMYIHVGPVLLAALWCWVFDSRGEILLWIVVVTELLISILCQYYAWLWGRKNNEKSIAVN